MASMYRSGASRRKAETPGKIRIQLKGKNTVVINNDSENLDDTGEKNDDGDNGSVSFENGIPTSLPEGTCIVQPEPVEETPQKKKREAPVKIDTSVLDNVACTACGRQVNPYKSGALHKHPILKVVICRRCERFVTSSVISKDKAGADTQCRWCGEAGRLVVCDECSTAFCKSCVMRNFNRSEFNNINGQEKWKCYMCNKTALQPLRDNYRKIKDTLKALQEKDKSKSSASAANAADHSGNASEKLSGSKQASKVVSTGGPQASNQKTPSLNSSVSAGSKSSSLASPDLKTTPSSFQSGQTPKTLAQSGVKPSPLAQPGPKSSPAAQSGPKSSALNQSSPSTSTPQATPSLKTTSGVIEGQKNSSQPEKSGSSHQSASSLSADRKSLSGSLAAQKTPAQVEGAGMAATSSSQRMNSGSMSAQKMSHFDGLGSSSHKMYSGGSHKSSSRYDSMGGYSPSGHKYNSDLSHKFFSGMGLNNIIFNLDDMNITFENVFSNISKLAIATNTFSEMLHVLQSQSQLAMSGNVNMQALRIHCVKTLNMGIESYLKSLKTILSGSPYLSDSMMYTAGMLGGLGSSSLSASEALALSRLSASPGMMSMGSNMGFHPNGDIDSYLLQQSCSPSGSASTRHTSSDVVPEANKSAAKESNAEEPKSAQQGMVDTQERQSIKEESSNNQPEAAEITPISSVDNAQTSNANLEHPVKIKQEPPVTEVNTNTDGSSLPKTIEAEKLPEPTKGIPEEKSLQGENKTNTRPAEKLKPEYKKKLSLQMGSDFSNKLSKKLMEKDLVLTSQPAVVSVEQQVDAKFDVTKKVADETATETDVKDINNKSACSSVESSGRSKDTKKQKDAEAGAVDIKEETADIKVDAADEAEQQNAGEGLQAVSEDEVDLSTRIQRKKKATSPARSPARGESQTAKTAPTKVAADINSGEEVSEVEEKGEVSSPASSKQQVARKRKPVSSEMDMAAGEEKKTKVEAKSTGTALKKSKPGPKSSKTGTDYIDHCVVETEQQVNEEEAEVSDGEDEPPVTFYLNPADEEEIVDDGSALEIGWTEEVVDNENQIIEDVQLDEEEVAEEKKRVPKSKKSPKVTAKKLAKSNGGTVTNKKKRKKQASKVNSQEQSSESESDKDKPKKKKKNNHAEDEDDDPDKAEESSVSSIDSEEVSDSDEAVDSEEVEIGEEEAEVGEEEAEGEEEEEPKSKKKSKGKTPTKGKRKKKKVKKAGDDDDDDEEEDKDDESEEESKKTKKKKGKGKKAKKVASSDEDESEDDEKENKEGDKDDDDDEDDDDPSSSKAGKRKQIRKVMSNKRLEDSTRAANRAEEKRRKRISAKQREFNIETITDENNPMNCLITTKLVLEAGKEEGDEPIVQVNKKLVRKLKPHQVEAVQFMWDCMYESVKRSKKEPGAGCILAHCMGLGKTLSVITFVHTILSHEKVLKHRTCLVVSPLNTVLNWRNEWSMWLDEEDRLEVWELASCKQNAARVEALKDWQASGGIMIMGYEMYRNLTTGSRCKNKRQKKVFQDTLVDPGPDLVICDEGHILKNEASAISKAMNQMKTKRRVVLTGTPLQNNLNEYHCMVSFVKPSLLGTRKEFNNRFISPIQNGQCTDSNSRDVKIMKARAHVLHEMLAGCVQRRDYSALTKFLPPKQEYVISVRLTSIQIELYEKYLQMTGQGVDGVYSNKGARLFADYQNLMKIWTHPWVLKLAEIRDELKMKYDDDDSFIDEDSDEDRSFSSSSSSSDDENGMSDGGKKGNLKLNMQRGTKRTRAKARRQAGEESDPEEVIAEWKSKTRTNKQGDDDGKTEETDRSVSKDWWAAYVTEDDKLKLELSNKLHLLFEILRMCEEIGDKVLIFSQSILSLNIIESFLEVVDSKYQQECETLAEEDQDKEIFGRSWTKNIDYYRMDGTTSAQNRQLWASNFNDIDNYRARLFLISTRAGGLGINLVAANRVIIFDASWNPSHDVQSIFRVYRFGQTKPCYIYRFLAQGTMEEKIYERQVTKLSLSQRVVDEHQIERHFSANDLKELYNFRPDRWDDGTEKPTLPLPKDPLLAEILAVNRQCVVSFHEHDSLLENQIEQTLTEEEKKAAWEEYENEKKGIIIRGPGMERTASWPMMAAAQILSREQIQATVQALRQQLPDISEELFHLHLQQALRRQVQIKQEEMRRMELLRLQEMNYLNMIKQQAQQSGLTHAQSLQAMQNMAPWMQIQRLRAMQQSMLMGGGHFGMLPSASMSMLGQSLAGAGGLGGSKQDDSIDQDNN